MDFNKDSLEKPVIILGNGFNLALNELSSFRINLGYKNIVKEVLRKIQQDGEQSLYDFLSQNDLNESERIYDIEQLLCILQNMPNCIKYGDHIYCNKIDSQNCSIEKHRELLKRITLDVMTSSGFHPDYDCIINDTNKPLIDQLARNINIFGKIFTINYDLILYWALVEKDLLERKNSSGHIVSSGKFKDGFTSNQQFCLFDNGQKIRNLYGCSSNNVNANLLFLHGAIHLLEKDHRAYKVIRGDSHLKLTELRNFIKEQYDEMQISNLIVFDGTSYEKTKLIFHNTYLEKAYDKLLSIDNDIIVYGCNIEEKGEIFFGNDVHLWRRIISSNTNNIYVGIDHEDRKCLDAYSKKLYENSKSLGTPKMGAITYYCYPQKKVNIWQSDHFLDEVKEYCSKGNPN